MTLTKLLCRLGAMANDRKTWWRTIDVGAALEL
jgi:hypothetical protein